MSNASILLIDDEESLRDLFSRFLKMEGHEVTLAASGREGIGKLKNNRFDLVLTDLVMGEMDGIQVLQEIKNIDPTMFVILVTGQGTLDSAMDAIRWGASDYLLKPCTGTELNVRVQENLERRALHQRIRFYENLLSICSLCKKIQDDSQREPGKGEWMEFHDLVSRKKGVTIPKVRCDDCSKEQQE